MMEHRDLPATIPTIVAAEGIRGQRRAFLNCLEELLAHDDEHLRRGIARLREMMIEGQLKDRKSQTQG